MRIYEQFLVSGFYKIGGHAFDPKTLCCVTKYTSGDVCGRKLDDVLSEAYTAVVGQEGVVCVGRANDHELESLVKARKARDEVFDKML